MSIRTIRNDEREIDRYVRGAERSKNREYPMDWVFDFSYDLSVPEYYVTHRECGDCCDFHVVKGA